MRRYFVAVLVMLLPASIGFCTPLAGVDTPADFGALVRAFSENRYAMAKELSARLSLPLPPQADAFFRVAATGPWEAVSNSFEQVKQQTEYGTAITGLQNELWAPAHEAMGAWEVWIGWKQDSSLLALFHEPVLASMPKGSIYFGGTDYGRFVITAVNAVQDPPPVFCITQNALADYTYAAHLNAVYGDKIWMPKGTDSARAFQRYFEEVSTGKRPENAHIQKENGRVTITGVLGVMELNGILSEMIFEHNKDAHEFFVEESYVISWMYPYLEPHGLILKLNRQPIENLSDESVARDREFWDRHEKLIESQAGFAGNVEARKAYSKLRSAIAGIYAYRKLYDDGEAAFQQAIRLLPASPEASFRLAKMYEGQGKLPEAIRTMTAYLECALPDSRKSALEYIKKLEVRAQGSAGRTRAVTGESSGYRASEDAEAPEIPLLFSNRLSKHAREMALLRYDGEHTQEAVLRALRWLAVNQHPDGSWGSTKPAMTALALLAYLAHGETSRSEEFGPVVEKALSFLLDAQEPDGHFKGRDGHDYTHPIVTYALCEAYSMTRNPTIKDAAVKALDVVVRGQNPSGGFNYNLKPSTRNDTSYMAWCAQALKAGEVAGLGAVVDGLGNVLKKAVLGFRANYGERDGVGGFGYTGPSSAHGLSGAGAFAMQLLGEGKSKEVRNTIPALQQKFPFDWENPKGGSPLYYWSYITQASFHHGGRGWLDWNGKFSRGLVAAQKVIGRDRSRYVDQSSQPQEIGSWTSPSRDHTGGNGEVMETILCTLMLEVYYRHLPLVQ